ncbi:MAG: hydantoinase/oxoprolinase family protein [Fimbriiglobus sp.]
MTPVVLGLDVGGANLKAATADRRATSVPFPLWKEPDRLPAVLAELTARFPDATEFAVTMTGELCDCYETKRHGVAAILDATVAAARSRPVRVWSTDGRFVDTVEARRESGKVAAANWHALATFAGRLAPTHGGLLFDIGSTTSDVIPLAHGVPATRGQTDQDRLRFRELVYVGVTRTPVCAVVPERTMAELFATTRDVYTVLGELPEEPDTRDTADGRPATVPFALARLARMLGGDAETLPEDDVIRFAATAHERIMTTLCEAAREAFYNGGTGVELRTVIVSGAGEFLARRVVRRALGGAPIDRVVSLAEELGPAVSACSPAFALAVLATEDRA